MTPVPQHCPWAAGEQYIAYHDTEWGVPLHDDRRLFEFLILEGAQAGLSWATILKKRENYRAAFDHFDPALVARYGARKRKRLLANAGIVRNRLKIDSAIQNAKSFLEVREEFGTFDKYIWQFVGGRPKQNKWRSMQRRARQNSRVRRNEQRPPPPRLPLRRQHHLLRVHASRRHGQ